MLSAHPQTVHAQKYYTVVIPCALVVHLIYTPEAWGLTVYISGEPQVYMVYLLNKNVFYMKTCSVLIGAITWL